MTATHVPRAGRAKKTEFRCGGQAGVALPVDPEGAQADLAPHYLLEISRAGALDELTVKVEPHQSAAGDASGGLGRRMRSRSRSRPWSACVRKCPACEPDTIECSAGKAKRVVDLR